jgi:hypothetical protein
MAVQAVNFAASRAFGAFEHADAANLALHCGNELAAGGAHWFGRAAFFYSKDRFHYSHRSLRELKKTAGPGSFHS